MLWRIFGLKRDEIIGGWSFITCTHRHNLNDHVKEDEWGRKCSMHAGEKGMHTGILWENQNENDHQEDLNIEKRVILQWFNSQNFVEPKGMHK